MKVFVMIFLMYQWMNASINFGIAFSSIVYRCCLKDLFSRGGLLINWQWIVDYSSCFETLLLYCRMRAEWIPLKLYLINHLAQDFIYTWQLGVNSPPSISFIEDKKCKDLDIDETHIHMIWQYDILRCNAHTHFLNLLWINRSY